MLTPLILTGGTKQSESFELKQVDNSAGSENSFHKISRESEIDREGKGKRNIIRKVYQTVRRYVCMRKLEVGCLGGYRGWLTVSCISAHIVTKLEKIHCGSNN